MLQRSLAAQLLRVSYCLRCSHSTPSGHGAPQERLGAQHKEERVPEGTLPEF